RAPVYWRVKCVVSVGVRQLDSISLSGAPGTIERITDGDRWGLKQPISARADSGAVATLLTRLTTGQMRAVVAEEPATLDVYGLEPARTTVTLSGGGERLAQVLVGSESNGSAVHMKDAARTVVFTVDTSLASDLQRA